MKEQLVDFQTAIKAKLKGFDWVCRCWYSNRTLFEPLTPDNYNDETIFKNVVSTPTQSLLQR